MVARPEIQNSTRSGNQPTFINGFNSVPKSSTPQVNLQRQNEALSFLLDTVTQMNISNVELAVFDRYLIKQLRRSERLSDRNKCREMFEKKLRKFGHADEADRLKRCCANFTALVCENGHSFRAVPDYRCHLPFCPNCWETKSHRELQRTLPKFLQAIKNDPSLIIAFNTLTVKSDNGRSLVKGCRKLKTDFKALRRQKVWKNCVGGFGRVENTFSKKFGWHPHLHSILLLKNYIPQTALSDAWSGVTGGSMVVDIRTVHDVATGLVEAIKYPFKPADLRKLGKSQIDEMLEMKGERLGVSFGVLFGLEVDDDLGAETDTEYTEFIEATKVLEVGDPCPVCQTRLDLIDFTARGYAQFLGAVNVTARGSPRSDT
jgi:hypothetical protein